MAVIHRVREILRRLPGEEAGFSLLPWAILIAIAAATPIIIPAVQDIHDLATGKWDPKEREAPAPTANDLPFIGPGLPADKTKAECVEREAAKVGLTWTAKGWRTSEIDEPNLIGSPSQVRGNIEFFRRRMEAYVGSRQREWANCLKDPPSAEDITSSSVEPQIEFAGTYTPVYPPSATGTCPYAPPETITIAGTATTLTITATSSQFTDQLTGSVDRSGGFSANGLRDVGGGLGMRMLGRFKTDGSVTTITDGQLEFNGPELCTYEFTATKR
jgi:hypothetical protein